MLNELPRTYPFYRAMHFSAKRGIDIACRLSVCPSVCNVGGLWSHVGGWDTSEIISPLVSLRCSLSADPNFMGLLQGEHPQIWAQSDPRPCWFERRRHSIANCGRMVTDSAMVTMDWRAYRKLPSLFLMVQSLTPYDLPFPQNGVPYAPRYANGHISATAHSIHALI